MVYLHYHTHHLHTPWPYTHTPHTPHTLHATTAHYLSHTHTPTHLAATHLACCTHTLPHTAPPPITYAACAHYAHVFHLHARTLATTYLHTSYTCATHDCTLPLRLCTNTRTHTTPLPHRTVTAFLAARMHFCNIITAATPRLDTLRARFSALPPPHHRLLSLRRWMPAFYCAAGLPAALYLRLHYIPWVPFSDAAYHAHAYLYTTHHNTRMRCRSALRRRTARLPAFALLRLPAATPNILCCLRLRNSLRSISRGLTTPLPPAPRRLCCPCISYCRALRLPPHLDPPACLPPTPHGRSRTVQTVLGALPPALVGPFVFCHRRWRTTRRCCLRALRTAPFAVQRDAAVTINLALPILERTGCRFVRRCLRHCCHCRIFQAAAIPVRTPRAPCRTAAMMLPADCAYAQHMPAAWNCA